MAARLIETFRGAAWFMPLADLRDANQVLDRTLERLGIPRMPQVVPLEQIAAALAGHPASEHSASSVRQSTARGSSHTVSAAGHLPDRLASRLDPMSFDDALACALEALKGLAAPARPPRSEPAAVAPASHRS